jgi:hypothetical protein
MREGGPRPGGRRTAVMQMGRGGRAVTMGLLGGSARGTGRRIENDGSRLAGRVGVFVWSEAGSADGAFFCQGRFA